MKLARMLMLILDGAFKTIRFPLFSHSENAASQDEPINPFAELIEMGEHIESELRLNMGPSIKCQFKISMELKRVDTLDLTEETEYILYNAATRYEILLPRVDRKDFITKMILKLSKKMDNFKHVQKSGWSFHQSFYLDIKAITYKPYVGGSYIPTPEFIASKKAVINIKNEDDDCFLYSYLASRYPVEKDANRVSHYKKMIKSKKWTGYNSS